MINKALINFNEDKQKYEQELANVIEDKDKIAIKKKFKEVLKLYLFEANKMLKESFGLSPSPYYQTDGYNGLYQKGGKEIHIKSKSDYYKDLDNFLVSGTYFTLTDEKKALVNNAIYILKLYYEDSLS
jgi:hypothetical protein